MLMSKDVLLHERTIDHHMLVSQLEYYFLSFFSCFFFCFSAIHFLTVKFRENLPNSQKFRGSTQSGRSQGSQR